MDMGQDETVEAPNAYDLYAGRYDLLLDENRINAHMRRRMSCFQAETFPEGSRLLELGCGTGDEALALASRGCRIVALDPSSEMISVAERKARAHPSGARVDFRVGAARDLPDILGEATEPFDGAYSSFALSYEGDLGRVREGLAPLLPAGTVFLASSMNRMSAVEGVLAIGSLHPSLAGRRLAGSTTHKVGAVRTQVFCRSPTEVLRAFRPDFDLERLRGLPVLLPPAYANRPLLRVPALVDLLKDADSQAGAWPVLRWLGDHHVLWLRRRA